VCLSLGLSILRQSYRSFSGSTAEGEYRQLPSPSHPLITDSYVAGTEAGESGDDLIAEAGGDLVVVNVEYRLGVFGARQTALNASSSVDSAAGRVSLWL
jgi:hypothetical protein